MNGRKEALRWWCAHVAFRVRVSCIACGIVMAHLSRKLRTLVIVFLRFYSSANAPSNPGTIFLSFCAEFLLQISPKSGVCIQMWSSRVISFGAPHMDLGVLWRAAATCVVDVPSPCQEESNQALEESVQANIHEGGCDHVNAFTNDVTNTRNLGTFFLAFVHALVGMKFVEV